MEERREKREGHKSHKSCPKYNKIPYRGEKKIVYQIEGRICDFCDPRLTLMTDIFVISIRFFYFLHKTMYAFAVYRFSVNLYIIITKLFL